MHASFPLYAEQFYDRAILFRSKAADPLVCLLKIDPKPIMDTLRYSGAATVCTELEKLRGFHRKSIPD